MNKTTQIIIAIIALVLIGSAFYFAKNKNTDFATDKKAEAHPELVSMYPMLENDAYLKTPQYTEPKMSGDCGMKNSYYKKSYDKNSGWNNVMVIDCGSYYYIYNESDSNPATYGPFNQKSDNNPVASPTSEVTTNPNMSGGKYPNLVVISPNGGEKIPYGNIAMAGDLGFSWKSQGSNYKPTSKFTAFVIDENGTVVRNDPVSYKVEKTPGVFTTSFAGETNLKTNTKYKIKVCDEVDVGIMKCDESDNYFTITN